MFSSLDPWLIMRMLTLGLGQRGEDFGGDADAADHALADHGQHRHVALDLDAVRLDDAADLGDDFVLLAVQFLVGQDDRERVNAGRRVLVGDAVRLQNLQHLAPVAALLVHHRLLGEQRREPLAARDADDGGGARVALR